MKSMLLFIAILTASAANAEPVIERFDNVAFNWGTMRWEFFGEAILAESQGQDAFKLAEKQAWQEGLKTIQQAVADLQTSQLNSPKEQAVEIAKEATRTTFSKNTTYFSSGTVRVELLNSLVAARAPQDVENSSQVLENATNSALLISLDRTMSPLAVYRIVNEFGEVVFESKDVSSQYYNKSLMGRWFKGKSGKDFARYSGKDPVEVAAEVRGRDLLVKSATWKQATAGNEALLSQAKVLLILP